MRPSRALDSSLALLPELQLPGHRQGQLTQNLDLLFYQKALDFVVPNIGGARRLPFTTPLIHLQKMRHILWFCWIVVRKCVLRSAFTVRKKPQEQQK